MHFSNAIWSLGKKTTSELRAIMEMYAYVCIKYKESIVGSYFLMERHIYASNDFLL